jgi:serine/threonine protein kinase
MSNALLGKYRLEHSLGSGTHGDVYKATDISTGMHFAIKRAPICAGNLPREIGILERVKECPQCVKIHEYFIAKSSRGTVVCIVMEFLPMNLMEFINRGRAKSMSLDIFEEILKGLVFMHKKGIVHRDLKPENILIDPYRYPVAVKIADFGSSKILKSRNCPFVVTRFYRAPELIFGCCKYDTSIDIWALACIFIEILTSQPLFPSNSDGALFFDQVAKLGPPPAHILSRFSKISGNSIPSSIFLVSSSFPCSYLSSLLSPSLLRLLKSMLAWDPSQRPSASACLKILTLTK